MFVRRGLGAVAVVLAAFTGVGCSTEAPAVPVAASSSVAPAVRSAVAPERVVVRDDLRRVFTRLGVDGAFAMTDVARRETVVVNARRAAERRVPASTFKIPHSLVALETGAVRDVDEVIPWNGKPQPFPEWEQDMSMRQAITASNAGIYQVLAQRIGLAREKAWLHRLGYGNQATGADVTQFWLDGPLRISPREQASFLTRLARQELPASKTSQRAVRDIIKIEQKNGYTLYAKTGWQFVPDAPDLGWWSGWIERGNRTYTFSLNMDLPRDDLAAQRVPTGRELLTALKALPT
ncbi:class D beta-lactamase [Actinomadura flavalba]|uniref:class D beta-lactamase n=1 Tax=Actinomadura flavalba TaxID=1120938 RepID=UPI00035DA77D|nr:class D beta-lactamase [Actinomadura flavalba]